MLQAKHYTVVERGGWRTFAIPVRQDNFVYLLCHGNDAILVDAGAVDPIVACLREKQLFLRDVLLTHQHQDHTAGYDALMAGVDPVDSLEHMPFERLSLAGHTAKDVGYFFPDAGVVCTGDCLINGACGRVLGGSLEDLYQSLQQIKMLSMDTLVLGGHDYLVDNLHFALQNQPGNVAMQARLSRYAVDPASALFVTLEEEMATNPFLQSETFDAFARLRKAKDRY